MDRRDFIRVAGAAALGAGFFSWRARADLKPVARNLFHLADANSGNPGRDRDFINDLKSRISLQLRKDYDFLVSGKIDDPELSRVAARRFGAFFINRSAAPDYVLPSSVSKLAEELDQMSGSGRPVVLVTRRPLDRPLIGRPEIERQALLELVQQRPEVVLVVCGGGQNRASLLPGTSALMLATASACVYPCGGRSIRLEVLPDGTVSAQTDFVQTRLLVPLEETFQQEDNFAGKISRLGGRNDRALSFIAGKISPAPADLNPNLAPFRADSSTFDLAIVTDTHVTLDKLISNRDRRTLDFIGHATEKSGQAVLADIIAQIGEGRHRLEFYDETFRLNPDSDENYLEWPLDAVFFLGDLTEYGRHEESEIFRRIARRLPPHLLKNSLMTPGNHDYFSDLSVQGMATDRTGFCDFFREFGLAGGETFRTVPLTEWLTVIMLDSVIPTSSELGLIQERIDWLEDQLEQTREQTVIIAAHHDLYPISLVPPALNAYLHRFSDFSPILCSTRIQLQKLFARFPNVRICLSGHYHGTVADMFPKNPQVAGPDDGYTVHLHTPSTVEYPSGYRLLRVSRTRDRGRIEYHTAYTREWEIRKRSLEALGYRLSGIEGHRPPGYEGTVTEMQERPGFWGDLYRASPFDLIYFNVVGFKDGTGWLGHGNGRLRNINDSFEFDLP